MWMAPEKREVNRKKERADPENDRIGITQNRPETRMNKGSPASPRAHARKQEKQV